MNIKIKIGSKIFLIPTILPILGTALFLRLIFSKFGTLSLDQNTFIAWSNILVEKGFLNFYKSWSDYLPGYLYVLWLLGKIKGLLPLPEVLLFKLPAILADILTGFLIFKIVKKIKNPSGGGIGGKWGIIASCLYLFNPAILANSTFWGQVDSLTALFSILSIYLIETNPFLSSIFLTFGTLVKPQAAFVAPIILWLMIRNKWKVRKIVFYILGSLLLFLFGFYPFCGGRDLFSFIIERLSLSIGQYPYTSVNAFNFWGLFGFWKPDRLLFQISGLVASVLIPLIIFFKSKSKKNIEYLLASVIFLSSFLFMTRIHERHLLPFFAPLIISASMFPDTLFIYVVLSIIYVLNMRFAFVWISQDFKYIFSPPVIKLFSLINVLGLVFIVREFILKTGTNLINSIKKILANIKLKEVKDYFPDLNLPKKLTKLFILLILLFALLTRVVGLNSPKNEYFDEVYHAFTARQILNGNAKAWEWWNTPPEGFAYEWTHPPLAKLGMVLGMKIFGENSFGWRIPGAILGVGAVYLVYLIAKALFKDEIIGLISAFIFSLDGLVLTMSRIGMNDPYILLFILLAIYLFIKEKDFFSAISFGLALSSKWSALWAVPIFFVIWLVLRKMKFKLSLLWFVILPTLTYIASYIPMFLTGHNFDIFIGVQKQMWWYHTRLKATHPYTSAWWSWPFNVRPVYLYTSDEIGGMVARIYNLGNPIIFWFGLISVFASAVYSYLNKNKKLAIVVFSYFIFFVPWALSPRIMFFYHYLPSLPFLAITIGYILRRFPKLTTCYLLLATVLFLYFYPHWAGIKIPIWWDKTYYWFPSWR